MDKEILKQYIDACEQVKEAKADILRLKKNRKKIVQDRVSGSAHEFPYTAKSFHIEGLSYPVVKDPDELDRREAILQERLQRAQPAPRFRRQPQPQKTGSGLERHFQPAPLLRPEQPEGPQRPVPTSDRQATDTVPRAAE